MIHVKDELLEILAPVTLNSSSDCLKTCGPEDEITSPIEKQLDIFIREVNVVKFHLEYFMTNSVFRNE